MIYRFTQMNYPPQWRLRKLKLFVVGSVIGGFVVLGSGCAEYYCPATGIRSDKCENTCQPPVTYTFPSFDREAPSQSTKVHIFIDGNGYGKVTAKDQSSLLCESKDCGVIEGKIISCKQKTQCTQVVETGNTLTLLATEGNFSSFAGWGGDEDCQDGQLTMDKDKYCVAVFDISEKLLCEVGTGIGGLPPNLSPFDKKVFDKSVLAIRQLKALTPGQIAALTTGQIKALLRAHIAVLSTDQISGLTIDQIAVLSKDQIWTLSRDQISALTTDQIKALTTDQIKSLSTYMISLLTTAQIQAFTTDQIWALTADQIKSLTSADQIRRFTTAQKAALDARKRGLDIE